MSVKLNIGQRFYKLTLMEPLYKDRKWHWICLCDCGEETVVRQQNILTANTKSCGCIKYVRSGKGRRRRPTHIKNEFIYTELLIGDLTEEEIADKFNVSVRTVKNRKRELK